MKKFLYANTKVLYAGEEPLYVTVADEVVLPPAIGDDDIFVAHVPGGNVDYLFRQASSDGFLIGERVFTVGAGLVEARLNDESGPWLTPAAFNAAMVELGTEAQNAGFTFMFRITPSDPVIGRTVEIKLEYING